MFMSSIYDIALRSESLYTLQVHDDESWPGHFHESGL